MRWAAAHSRALARVSGDIAAAIRTDAATPKPPRAPRSQNRSDVSGVDVYGSTALLGRGLVGFVRPSLHVGERSLPWSLRHAAMRPSPGETSEAEARELSKRQRAASAPISFSMFRGVCPAPGRPALCVLLEARLDAALPPMGTSGQNFLMSASQGSAPRAAAGTSATTKTSQASRGKTDGSESGARVSWRLHIRAWWQSACHLMPLGSQ